jgi:hypothetical protein
MFIPDPDFYPSRISDPGSNNSTERGGGKFLFVLPFFSQKYHESVNNFILEQVKKTKNYQKYGFGIRDPEKKLFRIPDPGSKRQWIPGPDLQHWK